MDDNEPYCDFRMTVRVEIPNEPGEFARLATLLAEEGANLGAIDIVEVRKNRMVRDITFDGRSQAHADRVVERISPSPASACAPPPTACSSCTSAAKFRRAARFPSRRATPCR